jgi:hypothetical protein
MGNTPAILGLVERRGDVRSFKLGSPTRQEIAKAIAENVDPAPALHTDKAWVSPMTWSP